MKRLRLALYPGAVIHAPGDTVVVPVPADERPLRGDAGWIDWRQCGRISSQLQSEFVGGVRGEVALVPATRPLRAARLLLVGLGAARAVDDRLVQRVFCTAAEKLLALRCPLALVALPAALDAGGDAETLVRGCVQALSSSRGPAALRLVLPSGGAPEGSIEAALGAAASEAQSRRVTLELEHLVDDSGVALSA